MAEENHDDEWLELCRSSDIEELGEQRKILINGGIEVSGGSIVSGNPDLGEVYGAQNSGPTEEVINVRRKDFRAARALLEDEFGKIPLPENHYLHDFSDEELKDLLVDQDAWSPFDVAHARKIANVRGLNLDELNEESEKLSALRKEGKTAPTWLLVLGWVTVFTGGLFGVGIGWSLVYMVDKTPEGDYPTYNEKTREMGKKMLSSGIVMMIVWYHWEFFFKVFGLD